MPSLVWNLRILMGICDGAAQCGLGILYNLANNDMSLVYTHHNVINKDMIGVYSEHTVLIELHNTNEIKG